MAKSKRCLRGKKNFWQDLSGFFGPALGLLPFGLEFGWGGGKNFFLEPPPRDSFDYYFFFDRGKADFLSA